MSSDPAFLRKRFLKFIEKHWIQNNHSLKEISTIYLIAAYGYEKGQSDIVYVGSTTNLFLRYKSHKIPKQVQDSGRLNILYFVPMEKGFYDYEIKLIKKLKPKYNRQHKNGS